MPLKLTIAQRIANGREPTPGLSLWRCIGPIQSQQLAALVYTTLALVIWYRRVHFRYGRRIYNLVSLADTIRHRLRKFRPGF